MAQWGEINLNRRCLTCGGFCGVDGTHVCPAENGMGENQMVDAYAPLRRVLDLAVMQAAYGKGAERHGQGRPFGEQPMLEISRMLGCSPIGCMYQAIKKTQEASRMGPDAAKRELLGAINYLAGAYLLLEENKPT
jgi:hypothetical protein